MGGFWPAAFAHKSADAKESDTAKQQWHIPRHTGSRVLDEPGEHVCLLQRNMEIIAGQHSNCFLLRAFLMLFQRLDAFLSAIFLEVALSYRLERKVYKARRACNQVVSIFLNTVAVVNALFAHCILFAAVLS